MRIANPRLLKAPVSLWNMPGRDLFGRGDGVLADVGVGHVLPHGDNVVFCQLL